MERKHFGALILALLVHPGRALAVEHPKDSAPAGKATVKPPKATPSARPDASTAKPEPTTAKAGAASPKPDPAASKVAPAPSKPPSTDRAGASKATAKSPNGKAPVAAPKADAALPAALPDAESSQEGAATLDPKRGRGARNVGVERPALDSASAVAADSKPAEQRSAAASAASATGKNKKKGPEPRALQRREPDAAQRRQIAQGPTADDLRAGKDDSELRSLHEAELVLFPQPLPGFEPGWSWDLPRPLESLLPEVSAGAPPASRASMLPKESAPAADWLRALTMPNLPVRMEERVQRYLSFYRDTPSGRAIGRAWVKKSGRYAAALKAELAKAGLPTDLAFLSLIESGYNPTIVSPAGAAGLWQFMPDAGRAYGLCIDRWVDERLDPQRASEAAARYLSDLYRRFGSWDLSMAAYNMGHGGLSRAIRKYNTNDFWELSRYEASLPWETTLYVPKILATAILMTNKRAFGMDEVEADAPERFDTVLVASGIPLDDVAHLAAVPSATLEALNPQYLAGRTPPTAPGSGVQSWPVRLPLGKAKGVREALAREGPIDERFVPYVVRTGDTVESIALVRGATEAQIRALNRVDPKEVLAPGTILLVPHVERMKEAEAPDNVVVVPPRSFAYSHMKRVFYRVVTGDSLPRVADAFGVARGDVVLWNALDESARLHPGLLLQLYVPEARDLTQVRYLPESKAKILVAGSESFFDYFEGQNGKRRFVLRVKSGDSLAAIGKRYGATTASMERINRRSRTDALTPGEAVVVYTERPRPLPGDDIYVGQGTHSASTFGASDAASGVAAVAESAQE